MVAVLLQTILDFWGHTEEDSARDLTTSTGSYDNDNRHGGLDDDHMAT